MRSSTSPPSETTSARCETGTPLAAAEPVLSALGADRRRSIAATLLDTVFDQVLERGMFHVDLHPGNVLVEDDGSLPDPACSNSSTGRRTTNVSWNALSAR